jgi:Sulfotransferase domain
MRAPWVTKAFLRLNPAQRRWVLHRLGRFDPWEPEFDFTPPPVPKGLVAGPPDFVGIGAQKAGTTWWYDLIATHPGVSTPEHLSKERHLLDRMADHAFDATALEQFPRWFPRRPGTIAGEWTPDYATFPWAPEILRRAAPDVRLLMLVRDPIDRFRSGLDHYRKLGQPVDGMVLADAVARGFYAEVVATWTEVFGADRLLVLQYERCVLDTEGELARTFDHLGLTQYHVSTSERPPHPAPVARPPLDADAIDRLVALYRRDVEHLARVVPEIDLTLWPHFDHGNAPPEPRSAGPTPATRTRPQSDEVSGSRDGSESSPTVRP